VGRRCGLLRRNPPAPGFGHEPDLVGSPTSAAVGIAGTGNVTAGAQSDAAPARHDEELLLTDPVLAECVYVLELFCQVLSHADSSFRASGIT